MIDINVTNLFDLSYDQINPMKKTDLVSHIKNLKAKVTVDYTIKMLCYEISQLSTSMNNIMTENEKLSSQLMIVSNVNTLPPNTCGETMLRYLISLMRDQMKI